MLARLFGVMNRVDVVPLRDMRVMAGLMMVPRAVMLGGGAMMLRRLFVMLSGFEMMLRSGL